MTNFRANTWAKEMCRSGELVWHSRPRLCLGLGVFPDLLCSVSLCLRGEFQVQLLYDSTDHHRTRIGPCGERRTRAGDFGERACVGVDAVTGNRIRTAVGHVYELSLEIHSDGIRAGACGDGRSYDRKTTAALINAICGHSTIEKCGIGVLTGRFYRDSNRECHGSDGYGAGNYSVAGRDWAYLDAVRSEAPPANIKEPAGGVHGDSITHDGAKGRTRHRRQNACGWIDAVNENLRWSAVPYKQEPSCRIGCNLG